MARKNIVIWYIRGISHRVALCFVFPSSPASSVYTLSVNRLSIFSADLCRAGLAFVSGLLLLACGCGTSTKSTPGGVIGATGVGFSGKVLAGPQPVSGAAVQLYAAGSTGYGSAGTALLTTALTTNSTGVFTVPAGYACPSSSTQVYLIARGGNPGVSGTGNNSSLGLMAAIGSCGSIISGAAVVVNEVTTVGSVAALAAFYASGGNVGASSTNAKGLANAFGTAGQLVNMATGASPGASLPMGLSVPAAKINTLADIVNSCASTSGGAACTSLLTAATVAGGSTPKDTLDAVYGILRNPANNVKALYVLLPASQPFTPVASAVPEWTLAATWSGGGMNLPTAMAFDASGNGWVASYFSVLTELPPLGTGGSVQQIASASTVLMESYGLTVDGSNNIWVANEQSSKSINGGNGNVAKFSNTGQVLSGAGGYSAGGVFFPQGLAADTTGNVWVVDYGNSTMSLLSPSGSAVNGVTGWGAGQVALPVAVAVDASHNAWVANQSSSTVTRISADGSKITQISCCNGASGVAVDQGGNVWVANYFGNSISVVSSTGVVALNGQTGGGVDHPQAVAIDGAGRVWVGNYHAGTLSEFTGSTADAPGTPLSPATGLGTDAQLGSPFAIAVDQSGNLWVTNSNGSNTVTVFIGLAGPVKTPLLGPPQLP
ncbi:MAG: repeat containing protein [Edaphobacter sp.]|nr:repeat containing protein [Edaphobacter sp.]